MRLHNCFNSKPVLIRYLGRERDVQDGVPTASTSVGSANGNEALTAILARQTEILDRVAIATGTINSDTRVKLPTIKLPRFEGKRLEMFFRQFSFHYT